LSVPIKLIFLFFIISVAHAETSFTKILEVAESGDSMARVVVGYSYYFGEYRDGTAVKQDFNVAYAWAAEQVVVDIGVTGLACPCCVYSVEKNLGKLPEVDSVEVNLVADSPGRNLIKVFLKFGPRHLGFCDLETFRSMISINSAIFNNDVSMQVFKWKLVHLYSGTTFTE